jgi:cyclopropane-fatty-acyl-phospholipid synthase
MWTYYLLGSAAISRSRDSQLYQIVMTRTGRAQPACRIS